MKYNIGHSDKNKSVRKPINIALTMINDNYKQFEIIWIHYIPRGF